MIRFSNFVYFEDIEKTFQLFLCVYTFLSKWYPI